MRAQPVAFLVEGSKGKVCNIFGGRTVCKRLSEMGFNRGNEVEIIKNDVGPLVLGLNGSRVAVGRGMAMKIMVDPSDN